MLTLTVKTANSLAPGKPLTKPIIKVHMYIFERLHSKKQTPLESHAPTFLPIQDE